MALPEMDFRPLKGSGMERRPASESETATAGHPTILQTAQR